MNVDSEISADRERHRGGHRHEAERERYRGEQREHADRARVVGRVAIGGPSPEEVADAPGERRNPHDVVHVGLRELEALGQIEREDRQHRPWRNRRQRVAEHQRPHTALAQIRPCQLRRHVRALRQERRPRDGRPDQQPDDAERAGGHERGLPAVLNRQRSQQQRHHDRADRAAAEGERDAARPQVGGQRFDCRPQTAGERAAFSESEHGPRQGEPGKARHRARATCSPPSRRRRRAACRCAGRRDRARIPRPGCRACRSERRTTSRW